MSRSPLLCPLARSPGGREERDQGGSGEETLGGVVAFMGKTLMCATQMALN